MSFTSLVLLSLTDWGISFFFTDAEKDQAGIDDVTLLLTLSVFFVSCPPEVVHAKNLLEPCVDVFSSGWSSNNPTVGWINLSISISIYSLRGAKLTRFR